ncbi:bifunctional DNA-formamidopyrimidine glycosylase/DNA-(apurinic or apyrimidinic site) lyase [Paradevosia shaoguanensis]|uniref:bifunctional DNA-formamidopyrimidine glycosylase/DNA-(apurinic or apyrimidinic site) lyase n=1 Tax=Paradevosia shaoguanensis TaxID=1335043 RepID=UPI003C773202
MPELPEVETVRAGLAPYVEGARIQKVTLNRKDLRFPFGPDFVSELEGQTILRAARRAKYLLFPLSSGKTLLSHLGMTGSYRFVEFTYKDPSRYYEPPPGEKHDHVIFDLHHPALGDLHLIYADARRFGFMELFAHEEDSPYLKGLGPEPFGNAFNPAQLAARLKGRKSPIKTMLLDQRVVAGIGNIYASEVLHRAHIRPDCPSGALVDKPGRLDDLVFGVREVLAEAVEAGGSTLKDFRNAEGGSGYFQHHFAVYDREGEPCPTPLCTGTIHRIVQSGRSSFFCPVCQKGA